MSGNNSTDRHKRTLKVGKKEGRLGRGLGIWRTPWWVPWVLFLFFIYPYLELGEPCNPELPREIRWKEGRMKEEREIRMREGRRDEEKKEMPVLSGQRTGKGKPSWDLALGQSAHNHIASRVHWINTFPHLPPASSGSLKLPTAVSSVESRQVNLFPAPKSLVAVSCPVPSSNVSKPERSASTHMLNWNKVTAC